MSEADSYLGEIKMFGGNYTIEGWLPCDGRVLKISDYPILFSLIKTTYGGDGQNTFALPDLRSRVPVHYGTSSKSGRSFPLGEAGGSEDVTLQAENVAVHSHAVSVGSLQATTSVPSSAVYPAATGENWIYADTNSTPTTMNSAMVAPGGNPNPQPFTNIAPYAVANFMICYEGIWPPND